MNDIQNLFKDTIAEFMEADLDAEPDDALSYHRYDYKNKDTDNSRNGHSSKTLRTSFGDVEISVPRDRQGAFEPQLLKKNQNQHQSGYRGKDPVHVCQWDDDKQHRGSYPGYLRHRRLRHHRQMILPVAKEWQQRPLEPICTGVFLDAIHYHVRSEGQIVKKAVYIVICINLGIKKCFGYVGWRK